MGESIVIGKRTKEIVKGYSQELTSIGLMAAGKTTAHAPYQIIRDQLKGGHLIATVAGQGEFLIQDQWCKSTAGSVFIAPPGAAESFRPAKGKSWTFCWLHTYPAFFHDFEPTTCGLFDADITLFCHAIEGFIHSSLSEDYASTAAPWADLIRIYAQRFMHAQRGQTRLDKLWAAVAMDPGKAWDVEALCRIAAVSREQLRVFSRRETGRSPMQQVTHLRMLRAIELLQTCYYKLEVVAELVGYDNAFAFSNAFLKSTGKRPSAYRSIQ
ncbi:AraC family transcriptional regulator [Luteolibacter pohnpeiensis]|uniref:AraC family transcriptional regulator n=1 Tax=Luteolibacter pohnpeiensis TaxID=454153 RepID=A0A934SDK0_9BACT|nr:AraC family transcriptional regulator [Luteolibacter pohnpeiensis]MBK1883263.1 AraC family transcriptional regulator [Luteolibacter pohnpeiensis]